MGCQEEWEAYEECVNKVLEEKKLGFLKKKDGGNQGGDQGG